MKAIVLAMSLLLLGFLVPACGNSNSPSSSKSSGYQTILKLRGFSVLFAREHERVSWKLFFSEGVIMRVDVKNRLISVPFLAFFLTSFTAFADNVPTPIDFHQTVLPILKDSCFACHVLGAAYSNTNAVMDKKYLPAAVNFMLNGFFNQGIVKNMQFGYYRLPVWRRG